jgi:hypothetical protein
LDLNSEIALNIVVYIALIVGLIQWRKQRLPQFTGPTAPFQLLEAYVKRIFPDMKDGFTWREAIFRIENLGIDLDWDKIQRDVGVYEAYRYGGRPLPPVSPESEFLKLLRQLRRVR